MKIAGAIIGLIAGLFSLLGAGCVMVVGTAGSALSTMGGQYGMDAESQQAISTVSSLSGLFLVAGLIGLVAAIVGLVGAGMSFGAKAATGGKLMLVVGIVAAVSNVGVSMMVTGTLGVSGLIVPALFVLAGFLAIQGAKQEAAAA